MSDSFAGLNPLSTASAQSWALPVLVYESGTVVDPVTFDVRPNVFTGWRLANADDDAAGLEIDVAVRDGLTFTGGTPLTADDVRFTYRYLSEQHARAPDPDVVVLDEPVSMLDAGTRADALSLLADLQHEYALPYVLVSHGYRLLRGV